MQPHSGTFIAVRGGNGAGSPAPSSFSPSPVTGVTGDHNIDPRPAPANQSSARPEEGSGIGNQFSRAVNGTYEVSQYSESHS